MTRATKIAAIDGRQKSRRCAECQTAMQSNREQHRYTLTPTWAITIADAEVFRCPKCGTSMAAVPKPDALLRTIATEVIRKPAVLTAPELVFLRRCLGLTGRKLSQSLGIAFETLSRYENGSLRLQPPVDRLVRMLVAVQFLRGSDHFGAEALAAIAADADPKPLRLAVALDAKGSWQRAAAEGK